MIETGSRVLRGVYTLKRRVSANGAQQLWLAETPDGERSLVKLWPFLEALPTPLEQSLWDRELRTLYRLASSPGADRRLVTLADACVDRDAGAFVLALRAPGTECLSDVLRNRSQYPWLSSMSDFGHRAALWRGALRLIEGLAEVHRQRSVHRSVDCATVFVDPAAGPETLRLSGFEWSARLGDIVPSTPVASSAAAHANASLNADWRDMGYLLCQLFGVHPVAGAGTDADNQAAGIHQNSRLTAPEKSFLRTLVRANGEGPIDRDDLERACRDVIDALVRPATWTESDRLGVVASFRKGIEPSELTQRIVAIDPNIIALDENALRRWLEEDLSDAEVLVGGERAAPTVFLKGRRLGYRLTQHEPNNSEAPPQRTWNLGFIRPMLYIDERTGTNVPLPFPRMIRVYTSSEARKSYHDICNQVSNWERLFPSLDDPDVQVDPPLRFLPRFLEVSNEIERAIRETEVYSVRVVESWYEGARRWAIVESRGRRPELAMSERTTPLRQLLADEETKGPVEVYLGEESDLRLDRFVNPREFWTIDFAERVGERVVTGEQIFVRRDVDLALPPADCFLRTRGLFGQVSLLVRRSDGIELLATHLFLQRALVLPDLVYMDTEVDSLPLEIPAEAKFDAAKREALRLIWRTRPLFCLQGPPGTGKTTLVSQLLRQIYEDDPSCQVLLTAQAHAAVDHLRDEVERFVTARKQEDRSWSAPLAVRLRRPKPGDRVREDDPASPIALARSILRDSICELATRDSLTAAARRWRSYAEEQLALIEAPPDEDRDDDTDGDFERLVRRSANFIYSSSTAQELLYLARSRQTFDWCVVEEAGKAHGFDLVLPLQTGHRWLLIGDQNQLPPYREKDFAYGLDKLREICQGNFELRRYFERCAPEELSEFVDNGKRWLYFFREVFRRAQSRIPAGLTPLSRMLTEQHRMHPSIGDLVSTSFYGGEIASRTIDEETTTPLERVRHRFEHPVELKGRAVAWIDVPETCEVAGEATGYEGRRVNEAEARAVESLLNALRPGDDTTPASMVILTPYRMQMGRLRRLRSPGWASPPEDVQRRGDGVPVFTVDSFQGRQAATVIVSLVRNNAERDINRALGFLRETERMNVMLSRAEQLLILVGSWEFFRAHLLEGEGKGSPVFEPLRKMIQWLECAFTDGRAVKLSASELVVRDSP